MQVSGEGHDVGDAMAWLPKKRILIAGDVVVAPTPYAIRGRVDEMIKSLQQIIDMDPVVVIPGHGEILQGTSYVKSEQELFKVVQQKSLEAIRAGIPYKEAITQITIPPDLEAKFTQNDDVRKWAMKSFFTTWTIYGTYKRENALPKK
jgi:glyoxylase-like metal-dependent hydrolase (beta-lactamase superfamily II)